MSHNKARFLVFLDKNRTTIALMFSLPLIGLLFWFMYATAVDNAGRRETAGREGEGRAVVLQPSESPTPKPKPDITTILGLKKPQAKLEQAPVIMITKEPAGQAVSNQNQQAPDPYPDSR